MEVLTVIGNGFKDAFLMAWTVWWALVFGFAISAVVQAWVPRERIQNAMGASGFRPVAIATGLGAASSFVLPKLCKRSDSHRTCPVPRYLTHSTSDLNHHGVCPNYMNHHVPGLDARDSRRRH